MPAKQTHVALLHGINVSVKDSRALLRCEPTDRTLTGAVGEEPMAYNEHLAQRIRAGFTKAQTRFEEKSMMGGLCFMVNGKMCVGVDKSRLMARIDPDGYETALRCKGCVTMDFTGRPMRGFVFVNPEGLSCSINSGSRSRRMRFRV